MVGGGAVEFDVAVVVLVRFDLLNGLFVPALPCFVVGLEQGLGLVVASVEGPAGVYAKVVCDEFFGVVEFLPVGPFAD